MGETNKEVCQKVVTILLKNNSSGLRWRVRETTKGISLLLLRSSYCLSEVLDTTQIKKVVIAYEPIWQLEPAILRLTKTLWNAAFIETVLTKLDDRNTAKKVKLIYGGPVKAHNAAELYKEGGMIGFWWVVRVWKRRIFEIVKAFRWNCYEKITEGMIWRVNMLVRASLNIPLDDGEVRNLFRLNRALLWHLDICTNKEQK